ncbi:hypothetical protein PMIN01_07280 [Paraphaeosphaeria minitans]|uniref:Uncharacterized protein n=1 Tax=Paraphaeosphaeria minitans TaxID=565426 RepID=A0A9P6KPS6_9PLEO|nr:hypothetical protein PMIN01_07280 [Paraphaeosphaeria minitans]
MCISPMSGRADLPQGPGSHLSRKVGGPCSAQHSLHQGASGRLRAAGPGVQRDAKIGSAGRHSPVQRRRNIGHDTALHGATRHGSTIQQTGTAMFHLGGTHRRPMQRPAERIKSGHARRQRGARRVDGQRAVAAASDDSRGCGWCRYLGGGGGGSGARMRWC